MLTASSVAAYVVQMRVWRSWCISYVNEHGPIGRWPKPTTTESRERSPGFAKVGSPEAFSALFGKNRRRFLGPKSTRASNYLGRPLSGTAVYGRHFCSRPVHADVGGGHLWQLSREKVC